MIIVGVSCSATEYAIWHGMFSAGFLLMWPKRQLSY